MEATQAPTGVGLVSAAPPQAQQKGRQRELLGAKLEDIHARHDEGWPAAVVLNLTPFVLKVEHQHIQYNIPACPEGKDFTAFPIATPRIFARYRSSRPDTVGGVDRDWDLEVIPPVEQAMEYDKVYNSSDETERAMGGVVVFEGTLDDLTRPKKEVRVPFYQRKGKARVVKFKSITIEKLIEQAEENLRQRALEMIQQGQTYHDSTTQKNFLTDVHRTFAKLAHRKRWITNLPQWDSSSNTLGDPCPKCSEEYRSKTGVCKCGYVRFPLLAYEAGEISTEHVRMETLTTEEWKKARALEAKRKKARE